ncbi:MAG TPA: anti-sigma factor [Ferruginibacter sp.]|nr:anti-sigma factor [Ferruginibacter sp.]
MQANDIISSGLLELHATGLSSGEEALQVEQWIKTHPEVAAEFTAIQKGLEAYAQANAVQPSPSLKEKIVSEINTKKGVKVVAPNTDAKTYVSPFWKYAAAASIILFVSSAVLNVSLYNKVDEAGKNLQQTQESLAALQQSNEDMKGSNQAMKEDMSVVQSKYSEPVMMHGMGVAPNAVAKIFWMKNTGDVYIDPSNLPDVPSDKQLQLWAIIDGKPVDAGMIITATNGDKYRIQKMKTFGRADAFAITIENKGGSPAPTMDKMVVMAKL